MRGSIARSLVGLAALVLLASGCGYDPFGPPSRVKSAAKVVGPEASKSKYLVFVVPTVPVGDLEVWCMRAQHEANDRRAVFRIMGPAPAESADQQPEVVRRAIADGASALIVYPGGSPELPKALAEAEAKGVPVVLIDKPVAAPEGSKPFTIVEPAPFEESARKIVSATIEDLKKAIRPVNGTAILMADKVHDETSSKRVAALKAAAEAAGFRQVVTVAFDGSTQDPPKQEVLDAIKANPDVSVVLTDDGEGMVGAAQARAELKGKPVFFVGGYTDYRSSRVIEPPFRESCHVEGRFTELGGLAVITALGRLRGESAGQYAYVTPKFTKTEGAVATAEDPKSSFPVVKRNDQFEKFNKNVEPTKNEGETKKEGETKPQ